ncbi:hydroxypyruvate isomerase family protein [Natronococcus roseus]|uniref:hydroxypyruvate isomerase family protein n=1 Tax=Natronococcus roseus TaxID=1052014 RepID=UPI00374DA76B
MIYEDEPFVDRIDRVADHGFDTVEFWSWHNKDLNAIKTRLDEQGVSLAAMGSRSEAEANPEEMTRALTNPETRAEAVEDIERSIETASRLNCSNLIVSVGPNGPYTRGEMYESIIKGLREVAPAAESADVTLVIEPLNTLVDHEGYFLSESSTGCDIVRDVNSPAVKLLFDIYHQQITEGNIINNITSNLNQIAHIHAADVPGRHEPGTGELNYRNVFTVLDDAGFNGSVGFEFSPADNAEQALTSIAALSESR